MIRVGTSGWSYDDWVGPFYPVALRGRPEQWLAHYATRFRAVEIHSTFDALPGPELLEDWSREAVKMAEHGGFELSLHLPREATHDALASGDVARARALVGRFDREVLDPLEGEGVLGAVLVRVPSDLPLDPGMVAALHETLGALTERRVALELGGAWIAQGCVAPAAETLFENPEVCLVERGGPGLAPHVRPPRRARHAYLRLEAPGADHLFGDAELAAWADRAQEHEARRTEARVVFANTAKAKAPANALRLLELLGRKPDVPMPKLTEQTRLEV